MPNSDARIFCVERLDVASASAAGREPGHPAADRELSHRAHCSSCSLTEPTSAREADPSVLTCGWPSGLSFRQEVDDSPFAHVALHARGPGGMARSVDAQADAQGIDSVAQSPAATAADAERPRARSVAVFDEGPHKYPPFGMGVEHSSSTNASIQNR